MANTKISDLTAASSLSGSDILPVVQSGTNKKITFTSLQDSIAGLSEDNMTAGSDILIGSTGITIDGGGTTITTGEKGFIQIPFNCTIESWTLIADQSGSIVIDIWKDTYANAPPTAGDTITASAKPTLSSAQKNTNSTLTGWTTTITAGDVLGFNVDSATTVTRVTLILKLEKT